MITMANVFGPEPLQLLELEEVKRLPGYYEAMARTDMLPEPFVVSRCHRQRFWLRQQVEEWVSATSPGYRISSDCRTTGLETDTAAARTVETRLRCSPP